LEQKPIFELMKPMKKENHLTYFFRASRYISPKQILRWRKRMPRPSAVPHWVIPT